MGGDGCEVPENADLTFYTTHPSTPPIMEDVACALLGEGGANDSLDFLKQSEEKATESAPSCPVGNLIVFTPTPKTNRRKCKWILEEHFTDVLGTSHCSQINCLQQNMVS